MTTPLITLRSQPSPRSAKKLQRLNRVEQRPPLVEQVVDRLRKHIISGDLAPDRDMPPEAELCNKMGVSRTVVREAMRILRAQGLVEVSQGKRPRVKPVDASYVIDGLTLMIQRADTSLLHLAELRKPLESEIAALAAERATAEQIERMAETIDELAAAPDLASQVDADMQFHSILAEATGNPIFQLILKTIWSLQRESRLKTLAYSRATVAVQWHKRILDAIRDHDVELARSEMSAHIEASRRDLLQSGAVNQQSSRGKKGE
jgi:GntR family transcriptional repressor for pyruvate dehydrogenase complex